jgi:hypothetical protein
VLLVRLNRPDRLNAYQFDMLDHLLREVDADNDVRMIVGTDPTFPRWRSIGVLELGRMMRLWPPAKTASKAAAKLGVAVTDQETDSLGVVAESHVQVAGLLGDPRSGGVGGDPGEGHPTAVVL